MPSAKPNLNRVPPRLEAVPTGRSFSDTPHPGPLPIGWGEGEERPKASWPGRGAALLLCTLGLLVAAAVLFCFNPSYHGFYPVCLFYRTTGLLCPGCGSLRAFHQLLHGHLVVAFHCNALLVLGLPLLAWMLGRYWVRRHRQLPASFAVRPLWLWGALGVMLVFSILRNLPGPQFAWLAP